MTAELKDKVAIITGAAGGIGAATARLFVERGASVMLVDREHALLEALAKTLERDDRVAIHAADVSVPAEVDAYVAATVARFGGLDVLFANAGTEGKVAPIVAVAPEDFDHVLAVNVRGPFLAIKAAAPHIARRGGGAIVVTSSVAGLIGSAGLSPYVTSKHAVVGLVRAAAIELASQGIRVNSLHPGPIDNRMMRSIEEQASPGHGAEVKAGFTAKVPLGRYGTNDEMAQLALFLCSGASSYCTGSQFVADGGFVAQ